MHYKQPLTATMESLALMWAVAAERGLLTESAQSLIALARRGRRVFAMTAAMPRGTGLDKFSLRRGHCGAARGHLRGGPGDGGLHSTFRQRALIKLVTSASCLTRAYL